MRSRHDLYAFHDGNKLSNFPPKKLNQKQKIKTLMSTSLTEIPRLKILYLYINTIVREKKCPLSIARMFHTSSSIPISMFYGSLHSQL